MPADYFFRDDIEADKQRAAEAQATGATALNPAPVQTMTAPAPAADPNKAVQDLGKVAATVAPPKTDYFADFRSALDAQDPFKQQAQKAVTDSLANPTQAFDAAASAQEDKLGREIGAEAERRRQQAILSFGGNQTGQVGKAMDNFGNEAIMKQAEMGRDIAAGRAQAAEAGRGNAINQSLALLGENRTGAAQAADIGLRQDESKAQVGIAQAQLAESARQFNTQQAFAEWATKEGWNQDAITRAWQSSENTKAIGSTEKIAFANLSQQDKELAQQAMQFKDKLSWDKEALRLGLDDAAAARIWQSAEGEKSRLSQEKIAFAQIGSQEKLQASAQVFEGAQAELNRSLEKLLSNDRIQAQFQLADLDQQFQQKMQAAGFVQEKDIEGMRQQLQITLQERGISADVAKQISDQKFTEMMAGRDQVFQQQMTEINQKFVTGERIDSQTWESAMKANDMAHDETMAKLSSVLRLGEQVNAQQFQTTFQQMQNDYTTMRDEKGYTHERAMQESTQAFQEKLEQSGYTHEEAMQATQLAAQASENQKSRASQETMAAAQLAMSDSQFRQEMQQRYDFNDQDMALRTKELTAQLGLMGLQSQQITQAMGDSRVKSAMDIAALGMEITNGSAEAMAPFVEQLGSALSTYMSAQGVNISSSDFTKSLSSGASSGSTTPAPRTETGGFQPGATVAGIDLATVTKEDWKSLSADPAKLSQFVKQGVVQEVANLGNLTRITGATEALKAAGLGDKIADTTSNTITFKPQTYIYYNGKPYEVTKYESALTGTGSFSDKSRNGYLRGIDLATGKEVVIKHDRENI